MLPSSALTTQERLHLALSVLSDKKAEKIVVLDLRPLAYNLCDYFVIATAESDRQAQAIADALLTRLKESEGRAMGYRLEGYEVGQWILLDMGDIVVHVQQPAVRDYYRLEELWEDAVATSYA
ncbi:MAG: ribosome silencing factor [Bacteroidia bacterium]